MSSFEVRPDGQVFEVDLMSLIHSCQEAHFPGVKPIVSGEFILTLDGPSRVLPELGKIEIKQCFSPFPKLCRLLVLHELIHNKLYWKHGGPQSDTGSAFREEVNSLWQQGAYSGLL